MNTKHEHETSLVFGLFYVFMPHVIQLFCSKLFVFKYFIYILYYIYLIIYITYIYSRNVNGIHGQKREHKANYMNVFHVTVWLITKKKKYLNRKDLGTLAE